jgi:hypothetical protein
MGELARSWGLRERGEWPRGRIPHERRAHVQVEAHSMAKGRGECVVLEGGAHHQERGRHVCERERAYGATRGEVSSPKGRTKGMEEGPRKTLGGFSKVCKEVGT